jgi:hypothetical protein
MKTIRCNPTWEASARILLAVITGSNSAVMRADAQEELLRGMRGYDAMLAKHTDYFGE